MAKTKGKKKERNAVKETKGKEDQEGFYVEDKRKTTRGKGFKKS